MAKHPLLRYSDAGFTSEILPVIPFDAALSTESRVKDADRGKVPGRMRADGRWTGYPGWTGVYATPSDIARWVTWPGVGVSNQCRTLPATDLDISDEALVDALIALADKMLGAAPVRYRENSNRRLLAYAAADGEDIRKSAIRFTLNGEKQALEFLATGQQYVPWGIHPTGFPYLWEGDLDPAAWGRDELTRITKAKVDAYMAAAAKVIQEHGGTMLEHSRPTAASTSPRLPIGHAAHLAADLSELASALQAIPNEEQDDYDKFIQTLAGLKAGCGGDEAFYSEHVEPWALLWSENTPESVRDKWDSITDAQIGADFIFSTARAEGKWTGGVTEFGPPVEDDTEDGGESDSAKPPRAWFDEWAWVSTLHRYLNVRSTKLFLEAAFDRENSRYGVLTSASQRASMLYQTSKHARKVESLTFRPGQPMFLREDGTHLANVWRPNMTLLDRKVTDDEVRPFIDHLKYVITGEAEQKIFINWWGYLLAHPDQNKVNWAMLLVGAQGIGKDALILAQKTFLGSRNWRGISQTDVEGQYTGWVAETQLVIIEEIEFFNHSHVNKIKKYITNPPEKVYVNIKHIAHYDTPNQAAFFALSNNRDALQLTKDDRRWCVEISEALPRAAAYFDALFRFLNDKHNVALVCTWLAQQDRTGFEPHGVAPQTRAKEEMRRSAQDDLTSWVETAIEDHEAPFDTDIVSVSDASERIPRNVRSGTSPKRLASALKEIGAMPLGQIRLPSEDSKQRARLWAVRDVAVYAELLRQGKLDEIRTAYITQRKTAKAEADAVTLKDLDDDDLTKLL